MAPREMMYRARHKQQLACFLIESLLWVNKARGPAAGHDDVENTQTKQQEN